MSAPSFHPRLLAIGGLIAMASAMGIGRFIYTPILPFMVEDLRLSKGEAGFIASANFVGYLAGAIAAASPRLSGSPRPWLLTALAVSALTTAAMTWPQSILAFVVLRFIGGVASAYVLVLASSLVLDRLGASGHSRLSAVHFSGVGVGIAASALLTWALGGAGLGWQSMWFWGGVMALCSVGIVAALVPGGAPAGPPPAATAEPAEQRRLKLLTLAYGLFGFGYVITATFIVVIVRGSPQAAHLEPVFWLVIGLAGIPSVAFWVAAGRRRGTIEAFACAAALEAVGVLASVVWQTVTGLLVASALLGGTFMGLTALGLIAARELAPGNPRRWLALVTSAFGVGQIIGPIVAGYGFDLTGSFLLPSLLAALALFACAGLALAINRHHAA